MMKYSPNEIYHENNHGTAIGLQTLSVESAGLPRFVDADI